MLCAPKSLDAEASGAVASAHAHANIVGVEIEIYICRHTKIPYKGGTFGALGAVLSKIDVFVKIVDHTTSVSVEAISRTNLTELFLGAPLCPASLASYLVGVQSKLEIKASPDFGSLVVQVVRNQVFTDQKLVTLVVAMERVFSFVDAIQSDITDKVKVLQDIIKRIFIQTVECGIFIREYTGHGFIGCVYYPAHIYKFLM